MRRGLTLIELTISVAIIALVGLLAMASFVQSRNVRDLSNSGQELLSILRQAQAKALAGENNSAWGVHLEGARFVLFRGTAFSGAPFIEEFVLPANIEMVNITLAGGGTDVVFNRLDGKTNQAGTLDVRVKSAANNTFAVTIDGSGKVYQTGTAPLPTGTRIIDTRHRNFTLAGNIKNSVTLTLRFSDPPNPDTIYPVVMTPVPPRTTFDWTGTVVVGGQNQTLRIHALSISDSATTLSVDRDCRKNTKGVKITFDTSDVATYDANCRDITLWPFGGSVTEP